MDKAEKGKNISEGKRKLHKLLVDGAKLTAARLAVNMKGQDVASALGCNKAHVSRWEQNKLVPSEDRLLAMVKLFGRIDFVIVNGRDADEVIAIGEKLKVALKEGK